jgi:hypothetical protein
MEAERIQELEKEVNKLQRIVKVLEKSLLEANLDLEAEKRETASLRMQIPYQPDSEFPRHV